jgi:hypothetical protein
MTTGADGPVQWTLHGAALILDRATEAFEGTREVALGDRRAHGIPIATPLASVPIREDSEGSVTSKLTA